MKPFFLPVFAVLRISIARTGLFCASLLVASTTSPAALLHEWSFNEASGNILDDSIGDADAEILILPNGGGYTFDGDSLRLDGGDRDSADYVEFPANLFDGLSDVTIEIWAAPHSFPNWGRVIEIGPGESISNPGENVFRLSFSIGTDGNQQRMGVRPLPNVDTELQTEIDRLYHYAIVWSATGADNGGGRLEWYRDGLLVGGVDTGTTTIADLANLPDTSIWLARSHFTADSVANASYHAMRVYDEALTPAVIALNTIRGPDGTGPAGVTGLIHRWSFAEEAGAIADSVGSAHGEVVVLGQPDHGRSDSRLHLEGGDRSTADYVEFPGGLISDLTAVTVEAWITPLSHQTWSRAFDFGNGNATANSWFLSLSRGDASAGLDQQRLEFAPFTVDTSVPTEPGREYHYVVTWSADGGTDGGGRLEWYRDGTFIDGLDTGSTTVAAVDDTVLWLGRSQWAADNTANAEWNEFRIYDRALTPAEIHFNTITGPDNLTVPPPVAHDDAITLNPGSLALLAVLNNDTGGMLDRSSVMILTPPAAGTAEIQPDGKILYTHAGGPAETDEFTYTVSNSLGTPSNPARVLVTVSAALRLPNTTITIPDEPPPVELGIEEAFPGLSFPNPLAARTPPGNDRQLFIVEREGIISYIPDVTSPTPERRVFLDIRDQVAFDSQSLGELGLLCMAFHPDFQTNGIFFVYYMAPGGSPYFARLSRFTVMMDQQGIPMLDAPVADPDSEQIFLNMLDREFNHNGGDLHFGPDDGYLYISMGDEGGQMNRRENAQRIDKNFYSSILRIDVDKLPGSVEPNAHPAIVTDDNGNAFYAIPSDNPFVGATAFNGSPIDPAEVRSEIWALGFRHPWRMSFDTLTGELWVGDVGQGTYEEINIVENGGNYGWAYREGFVQTPGTPSQYIGEPPPDFTSLDPLYAYSHSSSESGANFSGQSVTGGVVYRGTTIPELNGAYIFGDFVSGNIWSLRRENGSPDVQRLFGKTGIAAFGTDPSNGDVLLLDFVGNTIHRLVQRDVPTSGFPRRLSDTGIFADLETLTPNPGILPYEPNVSFWSDYATKQRWFTIPSLAPTIGFSKEGNWSFPSGMMWIKHFGMELERGNPDSVRRLETRVIVKTDEGNYGVTYKWNDDQTDAELVGEAGDTIPLTIDVDGEDRLQIWQIPSRASCTACHTAAGGHALSFNTRQLNRTATVSEFVHNQIDLLDRAGYFDAPVEDLHTLPAHAHADDTTRSLGSRVRAYLAVNCSQCHQPGGPAPGSWDARPSLSLAETRLVNGTARNPGDDPLNKLIVPGSLAHSILFQRISGGDGFSRMPPIATNELDPSAIALLAAWILEDLPGRLDYNAWKAQALPGLAEAETNPASDPDGDGASNNMEFLTGTDPLDATDLWSVSLEPVAGETTLTYERAPNLGVLIETSTNLRDWEPWNVLGNQPIYGSSTETITFPVSPDAPRQFFRARLIAP